MLRRSCVLLLSGPSKADGTKLFVQVRPLDSASISLEAVKNLCQGLFPKLEVLFKRELEEVGGLDGPGNIMKHLTSP